MERYKEFGNYGYTKVADGINQASHYPDLIAAGLLGILLIVLLIVGYRTWKNGESARIMKKADQLEEDRRIADALTNALDDLAIDPARRSHLQKQIGKFLKLRDMIPSKRFPTPQRHKEPVVEEQQVIVNTQPIAEKGKGEKVLELFKSGNAAA